MTTPAPRKLTKGERTQQRILQAALELFSEQGFATTSVRDIAARAGITHVGLIHHFPSKDDMLVRILEYREEQDRANAARFAELGIDRIFAWMVDIISTNIEHPDRIRLYVKLSAEATEESHPANAYFTRRYSLLLETVAAGFADHFAVTPPAFDITPEEAARSVIALMDGLQLQWLLFPGDVDMLAVLHTQLAPLGVTLPERSRPDPETP